MIKKNFYSLALLMAGVSAYSLNCPSQFSSDLSCHQVTDLLAKHLLHSRAGHHSGHIPETGFYLDGEVNQSSDGDLILSANKQAYSNPACPGGVCNYVSGRVTSSSTWTTAESKHGYIQVIAQMPVSPSGGYLNRFDGMWPAIWMMPQSGSSWPLSGEIDIAELHGNRNLEAMTTLHYGNQSGVTRYYDQTYPDNPAIHQSPVDYSQSHRYGLEWNFDTDSPYLATWYDGVQISKKYLNVAANSGNYNLWSNVFNRDGHATSHGFYLIMNLAVGGDFGPTTNATSDGSGRNASNPLLQLKISSVKSFDLG